MLFGYAYFNVLWNKMASERVRRFGLEPVEGDCVIVAEAAGSFGDKPGEERRAEAGAVEAEAEADAEPVDVVDVAEALEAAEEEEAVGGMAIPLLSVRHLTAAEAASGAFTIYDVVIPLPGSVSTQQDP